MTVNCTHTNYYAFTFVSSMNYEYFITVVWKHLKLKLVSSQNVIIIGYCGFLTYL